MLASDRRYPSFCTIVKALAHPIRAPILHPPRLSSVTISLRGGDKMAPQHITAEARTAASALSLHDGDVESFQGFKLEVAVDGLKVVLALVFIHECRRRKSKAPPECLRGKARHQSFCAYISSQTRGYHPLVLVSVHKLALNSYWLLWTVDGGR
eukprot:COSAG05_NODE_522_length_9020_cov_18.531891_9_plen_154_part_00